MHSNTALNEKPIESQRLAETLRLLMRNHSNISQAELARQTDIPPPTLHKILSGQTSDPRISTLITLASFFNVGLDQLTGLTPLDDAQQSSQPSIAIPVLDWQNVIKYPKLLTEIHANNWDNWTTVEKNSTNSFALISKPSMEPLFPRGSILIVNPEQRPRDGDYVVVFYDNTDEATLREITIDGPIQELLPITPNGQRNQLNDNVRVIGVVTQSRCIFD